MSRLLRPRAGEPVATTEFGWRSTILDAPQNWRERTRRAPERWLVHSRCWQSVAPVRPVPVVLVHGLGIASSMCVPLARRLAVDGATFAPDLPGFGRSEKPRPPLNIPEHGEVLGQWLRAETEGPAVVVGVSIGSQIALSAATSHPEEFAGVVLVSPTMDRDRRSWVA